MDLVLETNTETNPITHTTPERVAIQTMARSLSDVMKESNSSRNYTLLADQTMSQISHLKRKFSVVQEKNDANAKTIKNLKDQAAQDSMRIEALERNIQAQHVQTSKACNFPSEFCNPSETKAYNEVQNICSTYLKDDTKVTWMMAHLVGIHQNWEQNDQGVWEQSIDPNTMVNVDFFIKVYAKHFELMPEQTMHCQMALQRLATDQYIMTIRDNPKPEKADRQSKNTRNGKGGKGGKSGKGGNGGKGGKGKPKWVTNQSQYPFNPTTNWNSPPQGKEYYSYEGKGGKGKGYYGDKDQSFNNNGWASQY